jgi:hypothetical protein
MDIELKHIQEIVEIAVRLNKGKISVCNGLNVFYYPLNIEVSVSSSNAIALEYEHLHLRTYKTLICKFEKSEKINDWKLKEIRK